MPHDHFRSFPDSVTAPARTIFEIIPDDSADLPSITKALFVGTGGDIAVQSVDGDGAVVLRNIPDASFLDIRARSVHATGTSATDIVGLS